ncbi:MAG: lytic transglycosylase domain-containing protein [Tannerella sp.]|nr:lytic transglycosylase domain-containing protein [Tannerella sp.]
MKWFNRIIIFLTGVAVCLAVVLLVGNDDAVKVQEVRPVVRAMTVSPDAPMRVVFCGETVDLTRYNRHESMDRELSSFTYFHSTTMLLIKRANRYFPVIEPILKANGVPDDFKYLAVIESNLDPRAVSPSRARGMWQFMEGTAKDYKLVITPTVDERYNVVRSTEAACKYLKDAYAKYGDWKMVAASYNAGMGRISSENEKQGNVDALDLWLVEETSRYLYRIFAIKQIFENPYKYGFVLSARNLYKPIVCDEVSVSEDIPDLTAFAAKYNLTLADLKRFNPWLKDTKLVTDKRRFILLIPRSGELNYDNPDNVAVHDKRWTVN